jgi:long-chain acyl-CoA synthetase
MSARPTNGMTTGLSPAKIFTGRGIFILGATGFVGKVALSMLLARFPQVRRVYVMVRRGSGTDSESRFWNNVVPSPTFNPLREKYRDGFETFLRDKVRVVDGDITEPNLGMSEERAAEVAADIDVVLNSSGRVTFNPPLESALRTNVEGTRNVIAFVKRMKRPALVHTSTCFVAGNRSGEVWENEPLDGYFPRWREMPGTQFSVEQEIADSVRIAAEVRAQADDAQVMARLRRQARERLLEQGRDPDDEGTLRLAVARERKDWVRAELTSRGMARATEWGWPNIYTYTKSMGDQLVARETDIVRSIVRPAIVESALEYPFAGWNEGFTTSAPLVYMALKGNHLLPISKRLVLDTVPVDHIAAGMLIVSAQCCVEEPHLVHQLSGGDLNPSRIDRVVTLTGLYKRKRLLDRETGNKFLNQLLARMEMRGVEYEEFERWSVPQVTRLARKVSSALDRMRPRWGGGRLSQTIDRLKKGVDEAVRVGDDARTNVDLFLPFIRDNEYIFRADNIRSVRDRMPAEDQGLVPWNPEGIDWYEYFMNVHFPGLQKWVFPEMAEAYEPRPKTVYVHRDLLELFDTTTKLNATRVAMRMNRGPGKDARWESYTYDNLQELATRLGCFLLGEGVGVADRVIVFAKNAPEWGMAYFGILKAGGTAVPIAHESSVAEVVNIARAAGAKGVLVGDDLAAATALPAALKDAGLEVAVWPLARAFAIPPVAEEDERKARLPRKGNAEALASLIFTSGTTGNPKGVMLTHRNLTFMVSELVRVFEFGPSDGVLSVLPLHHTLEFTAGLVVPLSRGAQITYMSELSGDAINRALQESQVTAIVGVPALWDLLKRRVLSKLTDRAPFADRVVDALVKTNYELRARTRMNLGVLLFFPVHRGFGGRIRYFISGGSALSGDVLKTFYGMGFHFFEGYGLTETSPVLAVSSPKDRPKPGSVGKPLAGVEVKIAEADAHGVGEVVARGRNVMAGYWQNDAATAEAIRDGWFHTGDLGRFDKDGDLHLVGRTKDVIVEPSGKNVYPDEVEEAYAGCTLIKEMSVVGLPSEQGEQIACAVVPDLKREPDLDAASVRARIEEHFRAISQRLPFWKRVKLVEFWDGDLPRTSSKKVKRPLVVKELQGRRGQVDRQAERESRARVPSEADRGAGWFLEAVARVSGRPRASLTLASRVADLGFDSLMYSELAGALESDGVLLPQDTDFTGAPDLAGLLDIVREAQRGSPHVPRRKPAWMPELGVGNGKKDLRVPPAVSAAGKRGLRWGQRLLYEAVLHSKIAGKAHIPTNVPFIVAANHCSHLDMGLVKIALGDVGRDLTSLAAADYFFSSRWRRAYFENFTNLVPMERSGSVRKSLEIAESVIKRGRNMMIFPEGTRSTTGQIRDFLPSLGYLALRAGVGILPAYLIGTFEALPKGATVPRKRELGVAFGPFLSIDFLRELTEGLPGQEAWRLCATLTQRIVEGLRDGRSVGVDAAAIRGAWNGETLGAWSAPRKRVPGVVRAAVKPHAKPRKPAASP